ncbi:SH3 domain-containing protein [Bacillus sp. 2205SS5-2]|uniref:SH3 domain-containing protein n=1 Tax=Bacillus sp. 2205SS5-2 TaxID=3109031 RepID=UPI003004E207
MKNKSLLVICLFVLFGSLLPTPTYGADSVTVNTENLNVRSGPGLTYKVIGTVRKGQSYGVLNQKDDWTQIEVSRGKKGWVASWLVSITKKIETSPALFGYIKENGLRIRSGAGTNFSIIGSLYKGDKVEIIKEEGSWLHIVFKNEKGWVHRDYVNRQTQSEAPPVHTNKINQKAIITVDRLNVRNEPSLRGSILGTVQKGNTVYVLRGQKDWVEIQYGTSTAWVSSSFIQYVKKETAPPPQEPTTNALYGTVTVNKLNVRNQGSLNGQIIRSVSNGEKYKILDEQSNWAKIQLSEKESGWVAGWYLQKSYSNEKPSSPADRPSTSKGNVQIIYNGTNIRAGASVNKPVIKRVFAGEEFPILQKEGDWFKISLADGKIGYVAGWVVTTKTASEKPDPTPPPASPNENSLSGKTILLDPGHGGIDSGTIGARGTLEKLITLKTAESLYSKLKRAGAKVVLTRKNDSYVSLRTRVSLSHYYAADAFLSLHFDSIHDPSVTGHTAYYYHGYQKDLATSISSKLSKAIASKNRGVRQGNYHVIRENKRPAVLLELGFLSNINEELTVNSKQFTEMSTTGVYNGLVHNFQ